MPLFLFGIAWFDLITTKPLLTQFAEAGCASGTQAAALGEASGTLPGRLTHPVPKMGQHFAFGLAVTSQLRLPLGFSPSG